MNTTIIRTAAVAAVGVVLLAGCSSQQPVAVKVKPTVAKTVSVRGVIVITGGNTNRDDDPAGSVCYTSGNSPLLPQPGPLDDVKAGAQVVVSSASGLTVGIGTLGRGSTTRAANPNGDHPDCAFTFTVAHVSAGQSFYGLKIGTHEKQVPGAAIRSPKLTFP